MQKQKRNCLIFTCQDAISVEEFKRENNPLEEELRKIEDEIPKLKEQIATLKHSYLRRNETSSEAKNLYETYLSMSEVERFGLVEEIVEAIIVGDSDIEFKLHYINKESPTLQKKTTTQPLTSSPYGNENNKEPNPLGSVLFSGLLIT